MISNAMIDYEAFNLDISPDVNSTPQIKTFVRVHCAECNQSKYGTFLVVMDLLKDHLKNFHGIKGNKE